jgi:hypothetical protein
MSHAESDDSRSIAPWWLILSLVGLDYFSTLAYVPSLAVQAVGIAAPIAAAVVALATLCLALPVYWYVVGRSPHGTGATGLLERLVSGWRGKLLVLFLLSFVATDYVVTQNLSIADAAEHLRANPHFQAHVQPLVERSLRWERWIDHPTWRRIAARLNTQLLVTLVLITGSFALWAYWRAGSTRRFLVVAAVVVVGYLSLNAIVTVSSLNYLTGDGQPLLEQWQSNLGQEIGLQGVDGWSWTMSLALLGLGLCSFPFVALGLSGFELSMAVAPMIHCRQSTPSGRLDGRIRDSRKLLVTATVIMALWLPSAVLVTTVLIPSSALHGEGTAVHRALAYLAHGGLLANGRPASELNPLFGSLFGNLYDLFTIAILCMAGACVIIALREYVPDYLQRLGMELELAHRLGVKMRFFNVIVLGVAVWFGASIDRMQWAYVTSVLALLTGAALAAVISIRHEQRGLWVKLPVALAALAFFLGMTLLCMGISTSGLEIALAFAGGILLTSAVSRWIRSTELRWEGFDFVDDDSRQRWEQCCACDFQILVPHRPGLHSRLDKEQQIRQRHRLTVEVPIILIEAALGDTSEFLQRPLVSVSRDGGVDVIQVTRCSSISHVLAAIALEMSRVGRPAELHCGWSDESPVAANLNFLLFGEGNIPWMVRELIRKAEPDASRRPLVILG